MNRWRFPIIGFFMTLMIGVLYAWSIFVKPLETEFGWIRTQTSIAFSISLVFFPLGMIVGGRLLDKYGPRVIGFIGGLIMAIGFILASYTQSLPWLYISYGVLVGFGIGIVNNTPVSTVVRWFPDRRGLVVGIQLLGFGLSTLVMGSIATSVIGSLGWRAAFRVFGVFAVILVSILAYFMRFPPQGYKPEGWVPTGAAKVAAAKVLNFTPSQVLMTSAFWFFWLWYVMNHIGGQMLLSQVAPWARGLNLSAGVAAALTGILSISNGVGRIFFGWYSDRVGRPAVMIISSALMFVGLLVSAWLPAFSPTLGILFGAILVGLSYGASVPMAASTMPDYFGTKHVGVNIGLVSTVEIFSGFIGPLLAANVFVKTGSYTNAFLIAAAIMLVSLIFPRLIKKPEQLPGEELTTAPAAR